MISICQAPRFVVTFVEAKHKQMFLIGNLENNVVLHRPPFPLFYSSKISAKYLEFPTVFEGNTVLYRAALKSKPTANDRHFNTLFVEPLLRKLTSILQIFSSRLDALRTLIIGRNSTENNQKTQKAVLRVSAARGNKDGTQKINQARVFRRRNFGQLFAGREAFIHRALVSHGRSVFN